MEGEEGYGCVLHDMAAITSTSDGICPGDGERVLFLFVAGTRDGGVL